MGIWQAIINAHAEICPQSGIIGVVVGVRHEDDITYRLKFYAFAYDLQGNLCDPETYGDPFAEDPYACDKLIFDEVINNKPVAKEARPPDTDDWPCWVGDDGSATQS